MRDAVMPQPDRDNQIFKKARALVRDANYNDSAAVDDIQSFLHANTHNGSLTGNYPSIYILGIRALLHSKYSFKDIPSILDMMTCVENAHIEVLDKIKRLFESDDLRAKTNKLLTEDEHNAFKETLASQSRLRYLWIDVLLEYCRLEVTHLWSTSSPRTIKQLNEYFPEVMKGSGNAPKQPSRLFHRCLSAEEKEELSEVGLECLIFIVNSCKWAEAQDMVLTDVLESRRKVSPITHDHTLESQQNRLLGYVNEVEKIIDRWESLDRDRNILFRRKAATNER